MRTKGIVFLLACVAIACARADAFFWINRTANRWLPFSTTSNWNKGESATGTAVSRVPGASDTIDYGLASGEYRHLLFDMGAQSVTVKGFTNQRRDALSHYLGVSNGTLTVTGDFAPRAFETTVANGGTLVVGGSSTNSIWGATGATCPYAVYAGGNLVMSGAYSLSGSFLTVKEGGSATFAVSTLGWDGSNAYTNSISNAGSLSIPNGFTVTTPTMANLLISGTNYRKPAFEIVQSSGTLTLGGDISRVSRCDDGYCPVRLLINGGMVAFNCSPKFNDVDVVIADNIETTFDVASGETLDLDRFSGGTESTVTKVGEGYVRPSDGAAYGLFVNGGGVVTISASEPIPENVSIADGTTICFGVPGTVLKPATFPNYAAYKYDVDLDAINPGETVLKSADATLLKAVYARLKERVSVSYVIEGNRIVYETRSSSASAYWTGAAGDGKWSTPENWEGGVVPGVFTTGGYSGDRAIFAESTGVAQTIDLEGLVSISNVTIVGKNAPTYTFGTSADQTLRFEPGGHFSIDADVLNMPVLNATIGFQAPSSVAASELTVVNHAVGELVLNDIGNARCSWIDSQSYQLRLLGTGPIRFAGTVKSIGNHVLDLYDSRADGKLTIASDLTVNFLQVDGGSTVATHPIEILSGNTLFLAGGSKLANLIRPTRFFGDGTLKLSSQQVNGTYVNGTLLGSSYYPVSIESRLASECLTASDFKSGFSLGSSAIVTLAPSYNAITGDIEVFAGSGRVRVSSIGESGKAGPLGLGKCVRLGNSGGLWYVGPGESAGRAIALSNGTCRVYQGGSGTLTMTSSPTVERSSTLQLWNTEGSDGVLHDGVWAAPLTNAPNTLAVYKYGVGRWIFTKENTYTGETRVETGTLRLEGDGAIPNSSLVRLVYGGTLELANAGDVVLKRIYADLGGGRVVLSGNTTLTVAVLDHTSTGTVSIETESSANTVTVNGKTASTARYDWLLINGKATAFNNSGRVIESLVTATDEIPAKGGILYDNSSKVYAITTPGTSGHITQASKGSVAIKSLSQQTTVPAQVEIPSGATLTLSGLYAAESAEPLTIGGFESDGTLTTTSSELILYPEAEENEINILSPFSFSTSVMLHKYGLGTVRVAQNLASWKGKICVDGGTFAISNSTDIAATLSGFGNVALEGPSTNAITTSQSGFRGKFILRGGVTRPSNGYAFGHYSYHQDVVVCSNATLDANTLASANTVYYNAIGLRIAGDGADGKGAIVMPRAAKSVRFGHLHLDGDASIGTLTTSGGSSYLHICGTMGYYDEPQACDFGGHTLRHEVVGPFSFQCCKIVNPGPIILGGGTLSEAQAYMILYSNTDLGETSDPPITLAQGGAINLGTSYTPGSKPNRRKLVITGNNALITIWGAGCDTNQNCWSGPIELQTSSSKLALRPSGNNNCDIMVAVHGQITGLGSIETGADSTRGRVYITNPNNAYTGTTKHRGQYGGSLHVDYPGSLPNYERVSVIGGRITVYTDGDSGSHWKRSDILSLVNNATFSAQSAGYPLGVIAIDARGCPGNTYELTLSNDDISGTNAGLGVDGGHLVIDGTIDSMPNLSAHRGTLSITGARERYLGNYALATSDGTNEMGVLSFEGGSTTYNSGIIRAGSGQWTIYNLGKIAVNDAALIGTPLDEGSVGELIDLGAYDAAGILDIGPGAIVSNGLRVATASTSGSRGSVLMHGGKAVFWGNASQQITMAGNANAYSYIGLEDGEYEQNGPCLMAATTSSKSDSRQALFYQSGGTFTHDCRNLDASFGDLSWRIGGTPYSYVRIYRTGGTLWIDRTLQLGYSNSTSYNNSDLVWTQGVGAGLAEVEKNFVLAGANNTTAILNLNGGVLKANKFFKLSGKTGNKAFVNFNGGTVIARTSNPIFGEVSGETSTPIDHATVFAGGAHIGVEAGMTATIGVTLHKPTGSGIVAITQPNWESIIPTNVCGRLVGPPAVVITDSTGYGASAIVEFDRERLMPGKVVVTSSGCNYKSPTVTFMIAHQKKWYGKATLSSLPTDGGLTVEGEGTIELDKENDYEGPTTVNSGTLRPMNASAIPEGSPIVLNGGMFDLNGLDDEFPVSRITMNAGGGLMNSAAGGVVPVHGSFVAEMDDLRAGKSFNYKGTVAFAADTTVTVVNASSDDFSASAPSSYTLFHVDGTLSGVENLSVVVEDLETATASWRITCAGGDVKFRCSRGNFIIMH